MQFLHRRHYIAVVVESKVQFYGKAALDEFDRKAEITAWISVGGKGRSQGRWF